MKIYRCKHCGNMVYLVQDSGVNPVCCGEPMTELVANTVDAALEKHVPVAQTAGNSVLVKIGSVAHPMLAEHYIQWIALETKHGVQFKFLHAGEAPQAEFQITDDDKPLKVYEYCNLHGLWSCNL